MPSYCQTVNQGCLTILSGGSKFPYVLLSFVLLCALGTLHAQQTEQNLRVGDWQSHLPYHTGLSVAQSDDLVYYSTDLALIAIDKGDKSQITYEKEEGLPLLNAATLSYFKPLEELVIGYKNGVVTTLKDGKFTSYTDIRDYSLPIDKQINKITSKDQNAILIATNYGLTELNLRENKFVFTSFTDGIPVYDALVHKGEYYMATNEGLFSFDSSTGNIIQDFGKWKNILNDLGISPQTPVKALAVLGDQLYFGAGTSLYKLAQNKAIVVLEEPDFNIINIRQSSDALLAVFQCKGNCNKGKAFKISGSKIEEINPGCIGVPIEGIVDQYGTVWMADMYYGFRYETADGQCKYLFPNSPFSRNATGIAFDKGGRALIAAGGYNETWTPIWRRDGFFRYDGKSWERFSDKNIPVIKDSLFYDISKIVVHPQTGNYFLASYLSGIAEMTADGEILHIWNKNNSALQGTIGDESRTRVADLAFDKDMNLWICNFGAGKPLVKFSADGEWTAYGNPLAGSSFSAIDVDDDFNVWIAVSSGDVSRGVVVFNEGDPGVEGDEKWRVFTSSNSALPSNIVNDIEVDLEGSVWACTSLGVFTFDCAGGDVFDPDRCQGDKRKVLVNGIPEYLLNYEIVHSVAVDGANRKWFGTESGIYLMSPSGEEQIANYNEKNSPLPDDKVQTLNIDSQTGIVFIGTNKGLIAVRTDATEAPHTFISDIEVFPNPVQPEYQGEIYIKGLAANARVKITDVDGQLVFETRANGGLASWNGQDFNGNKVSTGVYYIFATKFEEFTAPEAAIGKVVIVR